MTVETAARLCRCGRKAYSRGLCRSCYAVDWRARQQIDRQVVRTTTLHLRVLEDLAGSALHPHDKFWTRETLTAHLLKRHNRRFQSLLFLDELGNVHRVLHEVAVVA